MKGYITRQIIILLLFVLAIPISIALADYHYASHEGSNEYPYTSWATAADSIIKAVEAADAGDTVYVGSGTYYENVLVLDSIAVIGVGWDSSVVIQGDSDIFVFAISEDCLLEGLHIRDGRVGAYFGPMQDYRGVTIRNCKFTNNEDAVYGGLSDATIIDNLFQDNETGINLFDAQTTPLIQNNIILNSTSDNIHGFWIGADIRNNVIAYSGGRGVDIWHPYRFNVSNNLFYANTNPQTSHYQLALYDYQYPPIEGGSVTNNTFIPCGPLTRGMGIGEADSVVIINNILFKPYKPLSIEGHYLYFGYNDIYNNTYPSTIEVDDSVIEHNIDENPMLTSYDDGVRLQRYSPCIDAGHPDILDVDSTRSDIGYTGGPEGISYEYQDLAPERPDTLLITVSGDSVYLDWPPNDEADINSYNLYKDTQPDFPLITPYANIAHPESTFVDTEIDPDSTYYYKLTAVDINFHESDPSNEVSTRPTSIDDGPSYTVPSGIELLQNFPNPFNNATFIIYRINSPHPEHVNLSIYNVLGQKVKTVIDEVKPSGAYDFLWEAKDDDNRRVSSGTYFLILQKGGEVKRIKMVLLK
jgi:hypothetical protein